MRRDRRPYRDDRPDWRNPNMPVLIMHRVNGLVPVNPEFMSQVSRHKLANDIEPDWRRDPTYNLRRR